jgi:two-component system chemotaxis response regulator CheV
MTQSKILLETGTNELEIVEFFINEKLPNGSSYTGYYGVNVAKVLEIIREPRVTGMPQLRHESILGTFNLRNKVIPLVDLTIWLGKGTERDGVDKVIVTEFNNVVNAFLVSGVTRIHRLSWEQIEPPSEQVQKFSQDSITGVVRIEDRVVFILDMERIVSELNPDLGLRELQNEAIPETDFTYKTVIADDSTMIRHMIGSSLEKAGFNVIRTINGQKAWNQLLEFKKAAAETSRPLSDYVHVVVTDIEMPVMDGHTLTRKIKEDQELGKLPVILFSSLITESLRHKGNTVGADDQVSKPEIGELADRAASLADTYLGRTARN